MVKRSTIIIAVLAMLAFGACTCWGYTVSRWPVPGIPNTVFSPADSVMPGSVGYGGYGYPGYYGGYHGGYYGGYQGGQYGGYDRGYQGRGWRR
jgi:hypothetical protein